MFDVSAMLNCTGPAAALGGVTTVRGGKVGKSMNVKLLASQESRPAMTLSSKIERSQMGVPAVKKGRLAANLPSMMW